MGGSVSSLCVCVVLCLGALGERRRGREEIERLKDMWLTNERM